MAKIRVFFSGMCLNILNGTNEDKSRAASLDVVMLDGISNDGLGFRHFPALAVPQRHTVPGAVVDRVVATRTAGGDAQYFGVLDLTGFDCRLELTQPLGPTGVSLNQTPVPAGGRPASEAEWGSLQLVSDPARATKVAMKPVAGLTSPDEQGLRHRAVQATFHADAGSFGAAKPDAKYQGVCWRFYPDQQTQVFADSTVLSFECVEPMTLVGVGFGDRSGREFRLELGRLAPPDPLSDVDLYISNVPVQQLGGYDRNDFLPFGNVLTPAAAIPLHQHDVGGDPVYCMCAIAYN